MNTLRGRALASSNAILPIRVEARSVMSRVARASFPLSVWIRFSSLTYCRSAFGLIKTTILWIDSYKALGVFPHNN
jgi:hypothetical protein